MKRYFLNPGDILCAIVLISIGTAFTIFLTAFTFLDFPSSYTEAIVAVVSYLIPLTILVGGLLYLNKYSGYIDLFEDYILIKKGKNQETVKISDIRWIEIKYDLRNGIKGGARNKKDFQFFIRLYGQKENLNFIITNKIILEIIKRYDIRIMPDQYNEIYLSTGKFDFRYNKND